MAAGNIVFLVGSDELLTNNRQLVPDVPEEAPKIYRALHQAIQNGLVKSCHDLSEGGLAVTAAEMCIGGRLGLEVSMNSNLFDEVNGCLLVEISPTDISSFNGYFAGLPFTKIGTVTADPTLKFGGEEISVEELVHAFNIYNL